MCRRINLIYRDNIKITVGTDSIVWCGFCNKQLPTVVRVLSDNPKFDQTDGSNQ